MDAFDAAVAVGAPGADEALAGTERVDTDMAPLMVGEDFSYMLQARPGAFIFIGNGDSAGLHNPAYDFNDDILLTGAAYWGALAERWLAPA